MPSPAAGNRDGTVASHSTQELQVNNFSYLPEKMSKQTPQRAGCVFSWALVRFDDRPRSKKDLPSGRRYPRCDLLIIPLIREHSS